MKYHYQQTLVMIWTDGALICRVERIMPDGETII